MSEAEVKEYYLYIKSATSRNAGPARIAYILRDEYDNDLTKSVMDIGYHSVLESEKIALKEGIKATLSYVPAPDRLIVFSGNKNVIDLINKYSERPSREKTLFKEEIKNMIQDLDYFHLKHTMAGPFEDEDDILSRKLKESKDEEYLSMNPDK